MFQKSDVLFLKKKGYFFLWSPTPLLTDFSMQIISANLCFSFPIPCTSQISFDTGQVLVPPIETLLSHREKCCSCHLISLSGAGQNSFGHILDNCEMNFSPPAVPLCKPKVSVLLVTLPVARVHSRVCPAVSAWIYGSGSQGFSSCSGIAAELQLWVKSVQFLQGCTSPGPAQCVTCQEHIPWGCLSWLRRAAGKASRLLFFWG